MQNSNKSAKSKGIVALAVNTATTDYVAIAEQTLSLASHVLDLPYSLITEDKLSCGWTNNRHDVDNGQFVEWKNFGRNAVYDLSPYDETIVIDVDYVVQDRKLLDIFELPWDYMLMKSARSLNDEYVPPVMGLHSLPFVWATVFAFRKTPRARQFFDLIKRIEANYHYYRELFNVESRIYRNDYAFAMADVIINGFTTNLPGIPGQLLNITQPITSIELQDSMLVVKDQSSAYVIPQMNLHVMSKAYLQSDNFKKFIAHATA